MIDYLKEEGIEQLLIDEIQDFRNKYSVDKTQISRVPCPKYKYYGSKTLRQAIIAILAGENLLLTGPKATGKNVLAENLSYIFGRPQWDVSFYINIDAATLIGSDTLKDGQVVFREGPISQCAKYGGFGVLDEINMAKNESLAVLHAILDYRKTIDVPGYDKIVPHEAMRYIGTMNYGYAGTRELNEALTSRFVVIDLKPMEAEELKKLINSQFPTLKEKWCEQFTELFMDIRKKTDSLEISPKSLDLRGLLSAISLMERGMSTQDALSLGIINKVFDSFERDLVEDMVKARISNVKERSKLFHD